MEKRGKSRFLIKDKKGLSSLWDYLLKIILAVAVIVIVLFLYMAATKGFSGAANFIKNFFSFGV